MQQASPYVTHDILALCSGLQQLSSWFCPMGSAIVVARASIILRQAFMPQAGRSGMSAKLAYHWICWAFPDGMNLKGGTVHAQRAVRFAPTRGKTMRSPNGC